MKSIIDILFKSQGPRFKQFDSFETFYSREIFQEIRLEQEIWNKLVRLGGNDLI